MKLHDFPAEQQQLFNGPGGSDEKEWNVKGRARCTLTRRSQDIRQRKRELIIPTRWVRTNKNESIHNADFLAKSRLVQGFKDRCLGQCRRDAPTASHAESLCLSVCSYMQFILLSKDIKNAYFSGKDVGREIYLSNLVVLKAKKAIYGFSEVARLFWLALKEHLVSDGWKESRLEPALFHHQLIKS